MLMPKLENPWEIKSIYELQYFNCPSCSYKNESKQDFICHAFDIHPDSVDYLRNLTDGSLNDILCPWDSNDYKLEDYKENDVLKNLKVEANDEYEDFIGVHEIVSSDHETKNEEVEDGGLIINNHRKTSILSVMSKKLDIDGIIHNPNKSQGEYKCDICDKKFKTTIHVNFALKRFLTRRFLIQRFLKKIFDTKILTILT